MTATQRPPTSWAFRKAKKLLTSTLFPVGAVRTVILGPCRGTRYRIFPGFGHSYLYGGWEPRSTQLMAGHVKPGSVAFDLGANYGMHTLLLAKLVGPAGRVYAFEPNPEVFRALGEHLALNHFAAVTTLQMAISDAVGRAAFDQADHRGAGRLVSPAASVSRPTFDVETTTLDKFVLTDGNAPPDFMKIDIEGAESAALRGGERVLARYRPVLLVELHNPAEDRAVGRILKNLGYRATRVESGEAVENMESGWPDPAGMWGSVLALPTPHAAEVA
jgi:FkbM family methyltransferase